MYIYLHAFITTNVLIELNLIIAGNMKDMLFFKVTFDVLERTIEMCFSRFNFTIKLSLALLIASTLEAHW